MKKYILPFILTAVILSTSTVNAKKPNLTPEKTVDWADELNLSKEQQAQMHEIYNQSHEKIKSMMQQIDTLHREIACIKNEDDTKIRGILTEKQQVKFDKIKVRMNKDKPEFNGHDGSNGKKPSRKRMRQYGGLNLQS